MDDIILQWNKQFCCMSEDGSLITVIELQVMIFCLSLIWRKEFFYGSSYGHYFVLTF